MLWACLHLPQLALDGVLRRHPAPEAPLALVTGPAQKRVLAAVNAAAARAGLRAGQSLAAAHALLADFATVEYDGAEVARWREFLAAWAYRYSSHVAIAAFNGTPDDAIVLEIQASLRLFGPWPVFERRLRADLDALGFGHRIAVAPNPRAARVLAGMHDGLAIVHEATLRTALARTPVARALLAPGQAEALHAMGLRRLGQLFDAPRDALGKRFGPGLLQHLDRLRGAPEAIVAYAPPDRFDLRIELAYDIESSQALLFPLRRMTADLGAYLAGRDGGVQRFVVRLEHEHLPTPRWWSACSPPSATRRCCSFELSRSRLEQTQVPAPVRGMRLLAEELPPFVRPAANCSTNARHSPCPGTPLRERLRARPGRRRGAMAWPIATTTVPSRHGGACRCRRRPGCRCPPRRARPGCCRNRSRCAVTACNCWPVRNGSKAAGGTAATSAATTTWCRPATASVPGPSGPPATPMPR